MSTAAAGCCLASASFLKSQERITLPVANSSACKTTGSNLAWNPLQMSATLRCSSSYFATPHSNRLRRECIRPLPKGWLFKYKVPFSRARSGNDDMELEQLPESKKSDKEHFNLAKLSKSAKSNFIRILASASKPAMVAVIVALLLAQPTEDAFAASTGGRMGGKVFSAKPSPGGSYSGGSSGGRSYSGGGYAPPLYGSPFGLSPFGYSPFYGGGYGGGVFLGPSIGFGGGGTIILAMIAFATLRSVIGFIKDRFGGDNDDDRFD